MHLMRDVARNAPCLSGPELARLVADAKHKRSAQTDSELFVLMLVLRNDTVRIELDHAEREPVAMHDASVDPLPDPPQVQRLDAAKCTHRADLTSAQPSDALDRSSDMCIRCGEIETCEPLGLCAVCAIQTRMEVSDGLQQLRRYLAAWADFTEWLEERELERV
jgi:hypothetical protein